jgi:hypothetical protein
MENELEIKTWILICHTENCGNFKIPIEAKTDAAQFICGPCANKITDYREKQNA